MLLNLCLFIFIAHHSLVSLFDNSSMCMRFIPYMEEVLYSSCTDGKLFI